MMEMECKCCTARLVFPEGTDVVECPACATLNVRPKPVAQSLCACCLHPLTFQPLVHVLECPACGHLNTRPAP